MTSNPSHNAGSADASHTMSDVEKQQGLQDGVSHDKFISPGSLATKSDDVPDGPNNSDASNVHHSKPQSAFKNLGILDRFLAVWIFLAMAVGIILGNFVPSTERDLRKGSFVGVSIPIGT
jgi:hypothetical protein